MEALDKVRELPVTCMNDLVSVGQLIAGTRLFGCTNPQEGFIIAAICHQEGWTYAYFTQTYHFIAGKIAKRTDAMQAAFQKAGGNVEIKRRDGEGTIVLLSLGDTKYESKCLWEEIKNESYTKEKDGKTHKDNYSTPRRRMQMMWARAISDGVRTVYPAACQGTYTVEEVSDFSGDEDVPTTEKTVSAEDVRKRAGKIKPQGVEKVATDKQAEGVVVGHPPYSADKEAKPEQAQTVQQQQAQPQQQQQAQQPMTPFNYAERAAQDFSLCPISGPAYRMPWDSMSNDNLKAALELGSPQYPEMDNAGHKQAIQAILELRAANGTVK